MKCDRCNKPRIQLLVSYVECDCSVSKYPELTEGRFFWIDSENDFGLPEDSWWCTSEGNWHRTSWHQEVGGNNKILYALPGPQPDNVPIDVPVLDRPPFGAWGDRFYVWEDELRLIWHEYLYNGRIRTKDHRISCLIDEYRQRWRTMDESFWDASGTTRKAGLAWLDEMEII